MNATQRHAGTPEGVTQVQGVGPGSVLGGRYAVTVRTAHGAHHERWRADDHTLEREVVLVCFTAGSAIAAAALDAARRAAGVEDPRLVRVLDVGADQGVGFIVEEPLTDAEPLTQLLASGGLPSAEVRRLVGESASALDKARQRGLHHLALGPDSVLRMPDGAVKVRGLATEAALTDAELASGEQASRLDAIGLVKLTYAGLTGRWPTAAADPGTPRPVDLEPAPTVVGGVAAPSEIVVAVPNDLDLICRMTLNDDRGPLSPGDLALQIAPWASGPPSRDGASGIGLPAVRRPGDTSRRAATSPASTTASTTRRLPAVRGGGAGAAGFDADDPLRDSLGDSPHDDASATATLSPVAPGTAAVGAAAVGDGTAVGAAGASGASGADPAPAGSSGTKGAKAGAGLAAAGAAAGAAAAGVASAVGDRVGSFARAAADKASARAAERRAAHADDEFEGEQIHLDEALDQSPATRLEPPLPVFGRDAPDSPSKASSRLALAIVGALVVVALAIGINNVAKIGSSDRPAAAPQTVTMTRSSSTPASPSPTSTTPAPTTTTPAAPVTVTGGKGFDLQDGSESDQKVKLVYDGNPDTGWRSRWYGTPDYLGDKDGLGVVLDLDRSVAVTEVEVVLPKGAKQDGEVYLGTRDDSLDGAQKVGAFTDKDGTVKLTAPAGLKAGDKLIVWITKPAPDEAPNHYRAQISEVTVR